MQIEFVSKQHFYDLVRNANVPLRTQDGGPVAELVQDPLATIREVKRLLLAAAAARAIVAKWAALHASPCALLPASLA